MTAKRKHALMPGMPGKRRVNPRLASVRRRQRICARMRWVVIAAYKGGPNYLLDDAMRTLAGIRSAGSGYDFLSGVRDVDWRVGTQTIALRIAERLRLLRGVRVKVKEIEP